MIQAYKNWKKKKKKIIKILINFPGEAKLPTLPAIKKEVENKPPFNGYFFFQPFF